MFMQAVVIEVQRNRLLVLDLETRQNVLVNTPIARQFRPGDFINIWYNGAMTRSIPPQITALRITAAQPSLPMPCPPNGCAPGIRPPVLWPPILLPPPGRPPAGRPPDHRPGGPNRPGRPR